MSSDELFFVELLRALASEKLEAIIVGATAAVMQGAPVMTHDVDLLIRDTPRNRQKLRRLCVALHAHPIEGELGGTQTLVGGTAPVDILFDRLPGALSFEAIRDRGLRIEVGGEVAVVADLADVIASKQAADRPKDRAQLPILLETLRVRTALKEK